MTDSRLAVIVCDHGLGHHRRVFVILQELLRLVPTTTVSVFAPASAANRLRSWGQYESIMRDPRVAHYDFESETTLEALGEGRDRSTDWYKRLPSFAEEVVWSDNLPEVLIQRPDAIMTGSFLWHEVVESRFGSSSYVDRARGLLESCLPTFIGNSQFATPELARLPTFKGVGLYATFHLIPGSAKDSLYIGAGSGTKERKQAKALIARLCEAEAPPSGFSRVWAEAGLLPPEPPAWLRRADYTKEMFSSVLSGCVRPGFGIICDLLIASAKIFAVVPEPQFEMNHNSSVIRQLGVGDATSSYEKSFFLATEYASSEVIQRDFYSKVRHVRTDGARRSAEFIAERLTQS